MLSPFARSQCLIIIAAGAVLTGACLGLRWWGLAAVVAVATLALLAFFRDPNRQVPSRRGVVVSPADGRVRSIHRIDHFEPFDGPAHCVRIFLSVFDVHVQRSPLHGRVASIHRRDGPRGNALKEDSAEENAAVTMVLNHPTRDEPRAAVRQIVGMVARRIVCSPAEGDILQRGQRYGIIIFGSTVDLYLPEDQIAAIELQSGQRVNGGVTVVAELRLPEAAVAVHSAAGAVAAPVPHSPADG